MAGWNMPLLGLQDPMSGSVSIAAMATAPAAMGAELVCGPFGDAKDNFTVRQACAALERLIHIARKVLNTRATMGYPAGKSLGGFSGVVVLVCLRFQVHVSVSSSFNAHDVPF
jgi:hypothetical protein